ncbi:MAG: high light inducible protein [Synechococcus sp. TMED19]|jgi:hypothetical protein|nr:MAG: high light inducible protein [Synechococcus sp. TMED19]|tara:strand:- start:2292 stop:2462 length:171 start_codon:yes stop_codon:yes gene_type:complete
MPVTQEDGGRLNMFATEPRMRYAEPAAPGSNGKRLLLIGLGGAVVLAMMAVAFRIS